MLTINDIMRIVGFVLIQISMILGSAWYKKIDPDTHKAYQIYLMFIEVLSVAFLMYSTIFQR